MPSPTKKRKLNNGSKTSAAPAKGLEYFFNKQKQNASAEPAALVSETTTQLTSELTDEELARKLQDEWNQEVANGRQSDNEPEVQGSRSKGEQSGTSTGEVSQYETKETPAASTPAVEPPEDKAKKTLTLQSAGMSEDSVTSNIPLDESLLTFDPSKYVGQLYSLWASEGGDATYALLTRCFVLVSGTTSRIRIVDILVNCLRVLIEGDPSSLLPAVSSWLSCSISSDPRGLT